MGVMMLAAGKGSTVSSRPTAPTPTARIAALTEADRRQVRRRRMRARRPSRLRPARHRASPAASRSATRTSSPARGSRSRTTRSPPRRGRGRDRALRPRRCSKVQRGAAGAEGAASPHDAPAEFERLHRPAPHDPRRLGALAGAARDHPRAPLPTPNGRWCSRWTSWSAQFDEIEDPYLRERKADMQQVVERVLKALLGGRSDARRAGARRRSSKLIVVAHDLSPADMMLFKRPPLRRLRHRRRRRHLAHRDRRAQPRTSRRSSACTTRASMIREDELLIVDGDAGVVIVDPDPLVLAEYRAAPGASSRPSASKLQAPEERRRPRRSTARRSSCSPTSSCRRTWREVLESGRRRRRPVPHRVPVHEPQATCRARTSSSRPTATWSQAMKGRPVTHPHARHRRRQGARTAATARTPCRTRRWACARSATASPSRRCSSPSCARSCAPRTTARCGS